MTSLLEFEEDEENWTHVRTTMPKEHDELLPIKVDLADVSVAIDSVEVADHSTVLFRLDVRFNKSTFTIHKRFTQFEALHRSLVQDGKKARPFALPPKYTLYGGRSTKFLLDRAHALERYLEEVLRSPDLSSEDTQQVVHFLSIADHLRPVDDEAPILKLEFEKQLADLRAELTRKVSRRRRAPARGA